MVRELIIKSLILAREMIVMDRGNSLGLNALFSALSGLVEDGLLFN
ncbi:hypothetical protein [Pseudomonas sp. M30-35]|nr:hypothetical protein [Pseudomonas sp. M30-35]